MFEILRTSAVQRYGWIVNELRSRYARRANKKTHVTTPGTPTYTKYNGCLSDAMSPIRYTSDLYEVFRFSQSACTTNTLQYNFRPTAWAEYYKTTRL